MKRTETYAMSWVIRLIILNIAIFFVQSSFAVMGAGDEATFNDVLTMYLGLRPIAVLENYNIWQLFTYMFLHGGFFHIFLNMYALLIFGIPVEQAWGSRRFLIYYMFTGVGAGITILIINTLIGGVNYLTPTIGASGAVFGLLLAFGLLFPDAEILIFFFLPMKAKYLVFLYGGIELYSLISSGGASPVSHAGHLGGILFGIIFFLVLRKRGIKFKSRLIQARLNREIDRQEAKTESLSDSNEEILRKILDKVTAGGADSLTDDEYQFIRYMDIMAQDKNDLCVDEEFDPDEGYCSKCENVEACLVRRIHKFL